MRALRLVALLGVVAVALFAAAPAPAYAAPLRPAVDPCGAAPDWWDALNWLSWQACEVSNGGAAAGITQIVSPVLNTINDGISTLTGAVNYMEGQVVAAVGNVASVVSGVTDAVNGVKAFFQPQTADLDALKLDVTLIAAGYEPFHTASLVMAEVAKVQHGFATGSGHTYSGGPGVPGSSDYGAIGGGVQLFLNFLALCNIPQATIKALIDWGIALTILMSMARDIGVTFRSAV